MRKGNLEKKINEARAIHGDFYDYSLVLENEPKSIRNNVQIICPIHGVFEMSLDNHISKKQRCPKCSGVYHSTNEEFIEKCRMANDGKNYDFSEVEYKNCKTKVKVICHEKDILGNEHGAFWVRPDHLLRGHGCPKCAHRYLTNEEWIAMAKKVHGDKYDYSLVNYSNHQKDKGKFICHAKDDDGIEHGIFEQTYSSHLQGNGCPKCNGGVRHNGDIFERNARKIHGERYKYFNDKYVNAQTKVPIECPVHGVFYQTPTAHLSGEGCSYCKNSVLEDRVQRLLERIGLYFKKDVYIGLGKQTVDFFIPQKNLYIECQGEQHYVPTKFSPMMNDEEAKEMLEKRIQLDNDKFEKVANDGCELVYYTDVNTFHCKDVDVNGNWYCDKNVFTKIGLLEDYINEKAFYDCDIDVMDEKPIKRNHVTKRHRWNYETCEKEAEKYKNKYEMKIKNQPAYQVSVRNGWIDIFFPNSQSNRNWNVLENVLEAARQSSGAKDMIKKFGGAYNAARKNGWLDKLVYCS